MYFKCPRWVIQTAELELFPAYLSERRSCSYYIFRTHRMLDVIDCKKKTWRVNRSVRMSRWLFVATRTSIVRHRMKDFAQLSVLKSGIKYYIFTNEELWVNESSVTPNKLTDWLVVMSRFVFKKSYVIAETDHRGLFKGESAGWAPQYLMGTSVLSCYLSTWWVSTGYHPIFRYLRVKFGTEVLYLPSCFFVFYSEELNSIFWSARSLLEKIIYFQSTSFKVNLSLYWIRNDLRSK